MSTPAHTIQGGLITLTFTDNIYIIIYGMLCGMMIDFIPWIQRLINSDFGFGGKRFGESLYYKFHNMHLIIYNKLRFKIGKVWTYIILVVISIIIYGSTIHIIIDKGTHDPILGGWNIYGWVAELSFDPGFLIIIIIRYEKIILPVFNNNLNALCRLLGF